MDGWNRDEAQERAAWSRSGAAEWEFGGAAAQPSADDDDYLAAARHAQARRMGTLSIPVPDGDFDSFDFEAGSMEHDEQGGGAAAMAVPPPPSAGEIDGAIDAAMDAIGGGQLDAPPGVQPQWFPMRAPGDEEVEQQQQWFPARGSGDEGAQEFTPYPVPALAAEYARDDVNLC